MTEQTEKTATDNIPETLETRVKNLVYASTRYEVPSEEAPNFPNPERMGIEIRQYNERIDARIQELEDQRAEQVASLEQKKQKLAEDLEFLQSLTDDQIQQLSNRTRQWLYHALPELEPEEPEQAEIAETQGETQ